MARLYELYKDLQAADPQKRDIIAKEIVSLHKKNLWMVGVATTPYVAVVSSALHNVPPESFVYSWLFIAPRHSEPAQLFFSDPKRREE